MGVYSNAPKKDVLSNVNKAKAFVKVGRAVTFQLDLPAYLPAINRDEGMVVAAQAAIELPVDQLRYALFWFVKATPFDDIALNNLLAGNFAQAKEIWGKRTDMTSLLNLMACAVMEGDAATLAVKADTLFRTYAAQLCRMVNDTLALSPAQLTDLFVNMVKDDGTLDLTAMMRAPGTSTEWKKAIGSGMVKPIADRITMAVNEAKSAKGPAANYRAGEKLMNSTKADLLQLKGILGEADMQYRMLADKLATTILQCGINYFNDTEDDDAPQKAMRLQSYALSIAVGNLAKERCRENVEILKKMGPQHEVRKQTDALADMLKAFNETPQGAGGNGCRHTQGDITNLINRALPLLNYMRGKVGPNNETYLMISSAFVSAAVNALVEIINKEQDRAVHFGESGIRMLSQKVETAVVVMNEIGQLAMTAQRRAYYDRNKSALHSLDVQLQSRESSSSGGCYIATMAYGDYDHPQVKVLRQFRDTFLSRRKWGRRFIAYYYAHSPGWVERLKNHKHTNAVIRKLLDSFVYLWKKTSYYE